MAFCVLYLFRAARNLVECQLSSASLINISGWVKKKSIHHAMWHTRFLAIIGTKMILSRDEAMRQVEAMYSLDGVHVEPVSGCTPRFIFNDNLVVSLSSNEELLRWLSAIQMAQSHPDALKMEDFEILSVIGRGFFGKVMLVRHIETQKICALKTIHKARVIQCGKLPQIFAERQIMIKIRHPFIIKLYFAFHTPSKFYLGMEYAPGGELFYWINTHGILSNHDIRLWVAEIALALSFLHSLHIVYRDLKSENVLLDAAGHVKLADFGLSKEVNETNKTRTFCGTAEYLAPEIIQEKNYSFAVDYWSLGVLMYEMFFGTTPFEDMNRPKLYDNIIHVHIMFPHKIDPEAEAVIEGLLRYDPGTRFTLDDLKSHPYFDGLDWDTVYGMGYEPEEKPYVEDILIPSNFDPKFTSENPVDSFVQPVLDEEVLDFSYSDGSS